MYLVVLLRVTALEFYVMYEKTGLVSYFTMVLPGSIMHECDERTDGQIPLMSIAP